MTTRVTYETHYYEYPSVRSITHDTLAERLGAITAKGGRVVSVFANASIRGEQSVTIVVEREQRR